MRDPITPAYVIKGAVQTKKFGKFVSAVGQGEIGAMQFLVEVADILETQYEKRNYDDFDHAVFAYEVAEPFGAKVAKAVAKAGIISGPGVERIANKLLDEVSRSALSEDVQRIEYDKQLRYDKQFGNSNDLEDSYRASNMSEHPMFPVADWRAEVVNGDTQDGYWDWVYNCVHNWEEPTRNHLKITCNGMTVDCYGEWQEDSNCSCVGDWADGTEMNEIWAGDGWPHEGMPANWIQVVEHITTWAKRNGHTIYELSAC